MSVASMFVALALVACPSPEGSSPSPTASTPAGMSPSPSQALATQSAAATPEPTATTPAAAAELAWQRIDPFPDADEGSAAVSVTAGGPGFVAVGITGISPTGQQNAAVWTSPDGLDWSSVEDMNGGLQTASMAGVTARDSLLVAVGRSLVSVDQDIAAAWTSNDGTTWDRVSLEGQIEHFEGTQMIGVTAGEAGFVAVGSAPRMDASAAWTSTDGLAWQRVPHGPVFETSFMWSVTTGGPGFVAVGWEGRPEIRAAVWTSPDGVEWTLAEPLPGGEEFQARSVAEGEDGTLVAVGDSIGGGQSAIWTSQDGVTWTAVGDPAMFEGTLVSSVVAFRGGFLAAGSVTAGGGVGVDAAVWTSPDGEEWTLHQETDAFPNAYIAGLFADDDEVVAVGASQQNLEGTGSVIQAATAWYACADC